MSVMMGLQALHQNPATMNVISALDIRQKVSLSSGFLLRFKQFADREHEMWTYFIDFHYQFTVRLKFAQH